MTPDDATTLDTLISAGAGTIILVAISGVVFAAVLLLRRAPNAQADAFTLANGLLKTTAELSSEIREDGKRREAAAAAHVAALNATTEALRGIVTQQNKDSTTLGNINTAVTTQADARHRELMKVLDIQAQFHSAVVEEIRHAKGMINDLAKHVRKRKYGKPAPIRGALHRIERQLEKISHDTQIPTRAVVPLDWRGIVDSPYSPRPDGQPAAATNGNGNGANGHGWNTNDA